MSPIIFASLLVHRFSLIGNRLPFSFDFPETREHLWFNISGKVQNITLHFHDLVTGSIIVSFLI